MCSKLCDYDKIVSGLSLLLFCAEAFVLNLHSIPKDNELINISMTLLNGLSMAGLYYTGRTNKSNRQSITINNMADPEMPEQSNDQSLRTNPTTGEPFDGDSVVPNNSPV